MPEPKILPPTLRAKKRYIVFEAISESPIQYNDLVNALWSSLLAFLGELETSEAKLWIIQNLYDEKTQRGVIKCKHNYVEHLRAVLALITVIGETRAALKIHGVTGTIKSARTKYLAPKDLASFAREQPAG
ncbi:MAG: ribonuclease P protein component 2 [Candidatus Aenigmarchaeota archaeon]|nr:ribonuclease P protein component 2 [Candidatus Aenigmarchaeota archaeon]